jgi:hypothetical protein
MFSLFPDLTPVLTLNQNPCRSHLPTLIQGFRSTRLPHQPWSPDCYSCVNLESHELIHPQARKRRRSPR